jgi:hypothetical protein
MLIEKRSLEEEAYGRGELVRRGCNVEDGLFDRALIDGGGGLLGQVHEVLLIRGSLT